MRGVVTAGMAAALQRLELLDCFDAVYGSSAGAMAGAFFVAGAAPAGATVYYEEINNNTFINLWRLLTRKPVLDLNFLVRDVFHSRVPLDFTALQSSGVSLHVMATDTGTGQATSFSSFKDEEELRLALIASACNPLASGPPIALNGRYYWDAVLSESIPVRTAKKHGCTHFLVLRSREKGGIREAASWGEKIAARMWVAPHSHLMYQRICDKSEMYMEDLDALEELGEKQECVFPSRSFNVGQKTKNREALYAAARDGFQSVLSFFDEKRKYVGNTLDSY